MKTKHTITTLAVLALVVGCHQNEPTVNEPKPETVTTASDVADRYKEAATTTTAYVVENKDEFVAAMDKRLAQLDTKIGELATKADAYKDDAKAQADKAVAGLRDQRNDMTAKLDELKKSSGDAWKDVKAGFASALDELEKAYENAKSKFN
jgi:CHASE3 domain sensor protein